MMKKRRSKKRRKPFFSLVFFRITVNVAQKDTISDNRINGDKNSIQNPESTQNTTKL